MSAVAKSFGFGTLLTSVALLAGLAGCSADYAPAPSDLLSSAEENGTSAEAVTAAYPVGTTLRTTANLNLRTGPSTRNSVILVMPNGSTVTTLQSSPQDGWYNVRFNGHNGWAYGGYLRLVSTPSGSGGSGSGSSSSTALENAMARARAGVGFSYWWGHGRWSMSGPTSSTRGACSGSCPSCSHSGSYGADCSGYVAKIWAVPSSNNDVSEDSHPYSTYHFVNSTGGGQWSTISRSSLRRGDAMVYNTNGAGHMFLYESGDPWGSMWTYEARGCSYGIVHNLRTASTSYRAIRRTGF